MPYAQILISVLLIGGILLQSSEASLGSSFAGDSFSSVNHTKRGPEKTLFTITIVLAILFIIISFLNLVI